MSYLDWNAAGNAAPFTTTPIIENPIFENLNEDIDSDMDLMDSRLCQDANEGASS